MALEQTDTDAPDRPDVTAPPKIPASDVPNVTDDSEAASLASATPDASAPSTPSPPTAPAIPDKDPVTAFTDSDYAPIPQIDDKLRAHAQERAQENQDVKTYLQNPRQQFDPETGLPQVPRAEVKERTPAMKLQSNLGLFRDPLFWLGIVGSQFIKKGTGTAMAAATGMMEGFHKGDVERVKLEQEKFKRATKDVLKQSTLENSRLAEVWNNPDIPMAEKLPMMQAVAAEFGDMTIPRLIQENNLPAIDHIMRAREKSVEHLKKATEKYGRQDKAPTQQFSEDELRDLHEGKQKYATGNLGEQQKNAVRKQFGDVDETLFSRRTAEQRAAGTQAGKEQQFSPEQVEAIAQARAKGDTSALRGLPPALRAKAMIRAGEINPDLASSALKFSATSKAIQTAGAIEGRTTSALERALATAPVVKELSSKIDRTRFPDLNSVLLAAKQKTGDENVVRLGLALETLMANYATAMTGGIGGITEGAERRAHAMFNLGYSKGQMSAAVDQAIFELNRELKGSGAAIDRILGNFKAEGAPGRGFSAEQQQAIDWATAHPSDPRSQQIMQLYGF